MYSAVLQDKYFWQIANFIDSTKLSQAVASKILVFLISGYQKYISPYKGFSCAYRVLHNKESCSCYVKQIFLEQNFTSAIKMSLERFRECSSAYESFEKIKENEKVTTSPKRRKFIQLLLLGVLAPFLLGARGAGLGKCCGKSSKYSDDIIQLCRLHRCCGRLGKDDNNDNNDNNR